MLAKYSGPDPPFWGAGSLQRSLWSSMLPLTRLCADPFHPEVQEKKPPPPQAHITTDGQKNTPRVNFSAQSTENQPGWKGKEGERIQMRYTHKPTPQDEQQHYVL